MLLIPFEVGIQKGEAFTPHEDFETAVVKPKTDKASQSPDGITSLSQDFPNTILDLLRFDQAK